MRPGSAMVNASCFLFTFMPFIPPSYLLPFFFVIILRPFLRFGIPSLFFVLYRFLKQKTIKSAVHTQTSTSLAIIPRRRPRYVPILLCPPILGHPSQETPFPSCFAHNPPQIESNAENKIDAQGTQQTPVFASYRSLLDNHPLLRDHSRLESASKSAPDSSRSGSSSTIPRPDVDLGPLKQNAVLKYLSSGSGRICQYEVPGGGECRDQECENVHLSRLSGVEPSGTSVSHLCRFANPYILRLIHPPFALAPTPYPYRRGYGAVPVQYPPSWSTIRRPGVPGCA